MAQTDLQIHSSLTAGGELSPRALAERCCEERLTLAALTDRRAVSGVPECIWRGAQLGVRIVPGIELDCRWREQDFLTLGIGIDITCPALFEIERTRNDSVQSFAAEQAIHTIHEAGGLAVLMPPNEMDDTFPVAAFDGIAAYGSHSRADTARYWHADTVWSSPAAADFSVRTSRRTDRVQWTFMDTNRRLQRHFSPQSTI